MGLSVRLTPRAEQDLQEIRDYLLKRSVSGANRIRQTIDAALELLSDMPMMGAKTSEAKVRYVQLKNHPYRIFYVVRDEAIDVVHIRHTSRRPLTPSDT